MGTQNNLPQQIRDIIENDPLFFDTTAGPMRIQDALAASGDISKLSTIDDVLKSQKEYLERYIKKNVHAPIKRANELFKTTRRDSMKSTVSALYDVEQSILDRYNITPASFKNPAIPNWDELNNFPESIADLAANRSKEDFKKIKAGIKAHLKKGNVEEALLNLFEKDLVSEHILSKGTFKHIDVLAKMRKRISPESGFNPTFKKLREYEEELSAETKVFSARKFKAIVANDITMRGSAQQVPEGIKIHIEPGERPHRSGGSKTEEMIGSLLEESMPTRIDMYGQTDITISAQKITNLRQLKNKGFSTQGLGPVLRQLAKPESQGGYGANLYLRGTELVATGVQGTPGEHIAIPLFSKSISPSGSITGSSDATGYMFKGGSTYATVKDISVLGESGRLEKPKAFSEVVYSEISDVLNKGTDDIRKDINRALGTMDPMLDSGLDILQASKDSPGMIDPVRYAGGIKIGRSRRSTAHQRMIQVDKGTKLHNLLVQEQKARLNFFKGTPESSSKRTGIQTLRDTMEQKQQAVLDHIRGLNAEDPTSEFGKSVGHMNLAWTPQSAESIFRPPTEAEQKGRFYLKLNTRPVEDMSILAGQVPWEKGQQFGASITPVDIRAIGELPTSVSRMDSYKGETLAEIRQDVFDLSSRSRSIEDTNIAMGRKVIGLQFYNDELNKALFADSGAAMSGSLVRELDIDPVTNRTRHTVSHTLPLTSLMEHQTGEFGQLKLRGMLRSDLHQAISGKEDQLTRGDRTITFKPGEEVPVFLGESRVKHGKKVKRIQHTEPALPGIFHEDAKGEVVIGERVLNAKDVTKDDLLHANDISNTLRRRGMDPSKSVITGVRIAGRTGELQLIMAEKNAATQVDLGYAIDHKRVSVGQVLDQKAEDHLKKIAGISTDVDTPIVFGDLGLGIIQGEKKRLTTPSFGFNKTLMTNLADIISRQAAGDPNHKAAKAFVLAMGGEIDVVNIGGEKVLQFVNPGSIFTDRVGDKQFLQQFKKALGGDKALANQLFDETFAEISIKDTLQVLPGYKSLSKQKKENIKLLLAKDKTSTYQALRALGLIDDTSKKQLGVPGDKHIIMKQMAAQIGVRGEEPARTFGRSAVKVKLRDVAMLGESIEFARGMEVDGTQIDLAETMKAKEDLFMSFIDSNREILKKEDELSLIWQQEGLFGKSKEGFLKQAKAAETQAIGHLSRLTRPSGTSGLKIDPYRQSSKSIEWLGEQVGKRGRASIQDLGETILGMVDPDTGVVKISDQAYLVKGKHGPMVVPSAKTLQFAKETGFVRMPGSRNKDFQEIYAEAEKSLTSGRTAGKEAQAMYLDILQDVEDLKDMEESRKIAHVTGRGGLEEKLNHLYKVMAGNNLSKEGLYYNSTVDAKGLKFASELRLQTHGKVGKFEVGLTEDALRNMSFGNKYSDIDSIIDQARKGELYATVVREPAAGGRQQFSLKVKLLANTDLASKDIAKDFSFNGTAFLNSMMIEYGMEGDTDKDLVKLFRLNSMSDRTMRGIHDGQKEMMEGILSRLMDDPSNVVGGELANTLKTPGGQTPRTFGDIAGIISNLEDMTTQGTVRQHTFDSLVKIAGPKHATPLIESYYRGRSYLDYMVGQILDVQADGSGKNILRQNLLSRLKEDGAEELGTFLDKASMIMGATDSGKGRSATYHFTDARNMIKYMHLKKIAGGVDRGPANVIYDNMNLARGLIGESDSAFVQDLLHKTDSTRGRAREMIDDIAKELLVAADIRNADTNEAKLLRESSPETLNLLQNYAGTDRAMREAKALAHRMLFIEVLQTKLKVGTQGTALGGPFESIMRHMGIVMTHLSSEGILRTEAPAALAMADVQGLAGGDNIDEIIQQANREVMDGLARDTRERKRLGLQDAGSEGLVTSGSTSTVGKSGHRNAILSGEFFAKISRTKYFKPAAAIVGGLAGIEAARSAIDRFSPGNVPASMGSSGVMPPSPIMSSPQDPSFHVDGMPNTRIARVARSEGQRSSLNISGKMGGQADFRAMSNQHLLSGGYMPTVQGSFTSDLNDTMSRTEVSNHMEDRMNSVF